MKKPTPMMQQYMDIKEDHQDAILFFRLGDFYEMFLDDAIIASKELEITLTQRKSSGEEEGIPMCGIPHHVADTYLSRLVEKGYKVAICEQVEDPALAKGLVRREVVQVVTPGTIMDVNVLDEKTNNYLTAVYLDDMGVGIAYVDNSTGDMHTTEFIASEIDSYRFIIDELGKINPSELLVNEGFLTNKKFVNIIKNKINPYINSYEDKAKDLNVYDDNILKLFKIDKIEDLNLDKKLYSILATDKLIDYLYETQKNSLDHINTLVYYKPQDYMVLDINTRINLELHETIISKNKKGALISVLDKTSTAMGGRMLKNWIEQPLLKKVEIDKRYNMVEFFLDNLMVSDSVDKLLRGIYDIERLSTKISTGNCNGRELISLKNSLSKLPGLKQELLATNHKELKSLARAMDTMSDVHGLIDESIMETPPISITEGGLIKEGYSKGLDKVKSASKEGKDWLAKLETKEREKTGINNLKVGFNRVAGYFIEVTKANTDRVPDYFIRRQTLTNSERYHTEELKSMESEILGAEEKSLEMEYKIFVEIRESIKKEIIRLQHVSKLVSEIDVILSFAKVSTDNDYTRPRINEDGLIDIEDGRHPVVENMIDNALFVPNDTLLDQDENMIQIITGPNMSGKSTYMRQVAIIVLMAQIGCFIPAKSANIAIVDRIFTRIGASDNLSEGESTFMVEMNEVANIVRESTSNSLLILDEVGRGTSTYDGLSIAWALIEHIAANIGAKTLFATHYHELTQLSESHDVIKNMTISAKEEGNDIVFLRKVIEGSTSKSYGIQVARLAGIDEAILERANNVLISIEDSHDIVINEEKLKESTDQLNILDYKKDYYLDRISSINIDEITPIDALGMLNELVKEANSIREG